MRILKCQAEAAESLAQALSEDLPAPDVALVRLTARSPAEAEVVKAASSPAGEDRE